MTGETRTKRVADLTVSGRSDAQVWAMLRTAFAFAVKRSGASVRDAAKWMRVDPSTVQRGLKGKRPIRFEYVLRSRRLTKWFLMCLRIMARKNHVS